MITVPLDAGRFGPGYLHMVQVASGQTWQIFHYKQHVARLSRQSMLFLHFIQRGSEKHMEAFIPNILLIFNFTWTPWTTWTKPVFIRACAVQGASMWSTFAPESPHPGRCPASFICSNTPKR